MLANTAAHTGGLHKILTHGIWFREGLETGRLKTKFLNLENKPGICVSVSFVEVELLLADESLVPWKICHLRH